MIHTKTLNHVYKHTINTIDILSFNVKYTFFFVFLRSATLHVRRRRPRPSNFSRCRARRSPRPPARNPPQLPSPEPSLLELALGQIGPNPVRCSTMRAADTFLNSLPASSRRQVGRYANEESAGGDATFSYIQINVALRDIFGA